MAVGLAIAHTLRADTHAESIAEPAPDRRAQHLERINSGDPKALALEFPTIDRRLVVEGDMPMIDEDYQRHRAGVNSHTVSQATDSRELIVGETPEGKILCWKKPEHRKISFALDKETFVDEDFYSNIAEYAEQAAENWNRVGKTCCGIEFTYMSEFDENPTTSDVVFVIRELSLHSLIARAFFPGTRRDFREVLIDPWYEQSDFDNVGVMTHEFGHVLGFRHEQNQAGPELSGCYRDEDNNWRAVTKYDSKSVMHYLCKDAGTTDLKIQTSDIEGLVKLYGPGGDCDQMGIEDVDR